MKSSFIFNILLQCVLLIRSVFGKCGTSGNRKLGIHLNDDVNWAGSDDNIYGNVYANGKWVGWERLSHSGCDNFKVGEIDYFDDFNSVTSRWEGISLYVCGGDGILIETLYYWKGSSQASIHNWKAGVYGSFPAKCLYTDDVVADPKKPLSAYSDILIDGDTECCDGVTFSTPTSGSVGGIWTGDLPGIPDCN